MFQGKGVSGRVVGCISACVQGLLDQVHGLQRGAWFLLGCIVFSGLARADEQALDAYGGCREIKGRSTGFFHLEKNDKRWMFYTPEGHGFVPLGISGMHAQQEQWNGRTKAGTSHRDACLKKYGSIDAWKKATAERIRGWGFNYTGSFSYTELNSEGIPYIKTLSLTKYAIDERGPVCGNVWHKLGNNYHCPDLWHPELPAFMAGRMAKEKAAFSDPLLLFYYPDELDQLQGFADYADHLGWAALVGEERVTCKASGDPVGSQPTFVNYTKLRLLRYLEEKYVDIAMLNKAWGTVFGGFDELRSVRRDDASWGRSRDPQRKGFPGYRVDLDAFVELVGEQYVKLVKQVVLGQDQNHLIGFQLYGDHPRAALLKGMARQGHFDFYLADWGPEAYAEIKRPFMRLLYPSACNDSPLKFSGTCARVRLCLDDKGEKPVPADYQALKGDRLFLKIWDAAEDYWFDLNFAGGRLPIYFPNVPVPRDTITTPWHFQVLYTGRDDDGRSWFTVRSASPYNFGRAWELKEGIEALQAEGKQAEYRRSTAIPRSNFPTQAARGTWWAEQVGQVAKAQAANGEHFLLGAEWWKYMDNGWTYWVEQVNWGLVTLRDNAYDGHEAVRKGADGLLGTWDDEVADYGDCMTPVRAANTGIYRHILRESSRP